MTNIFFFIFTLIFPDEIIDQPKVLCGEWSPWFNTYDPIQNNGNEYELLKNIRDFEKICNHAFSIECRDSKTLVPHTETGDVFVESCTTTGGLICESTDYKSCNDYEIRIYCECMFRFTQYSISRLVVLVLIHTPISNF